jgi:hypothetical protein
MSYDVCLGYVWYLMYCPLVTELNGYFPTCCYIKLVRIFFYSSIAFIGSIAPVEIGMVELRLHSLGKFPNKPFFLFLFKIRSVRTKYGGNPSINVMLLSVLLINGKKHDNKSFCSQRHVCDKTQKPCPT